jgi:hypothetical protein
MLLPRGMQSFSHLSAVPVVAGVACLDARDCSGEVNLEKNILSKDPPWELVVLFSFHMAATLI